MHPVNRFFITAKEKTTLQQLLHSHLPPSYDVPLIISCGGVWKDKKRLLDADFPILAGETLKIHTSSFQGKVYTLNPDHIVFENADILVAYKPADLNVHQVPSAFNYNLTFGVNRYLAAQGLSFEATPITRLDRPVQGLVIFAKNKASEIHLFNAIKTRKIQKWYSAALEKGGNQLPCRLRIRDIIHNDGNRTQADPGGKPAHSLFIKTESQEKVDLYSAFIFTGRRHQIRFHASHYLAPVWGDWFYGSTKRFKNDWIALLCRGYNIPYQKKTIRVRLSNPLLEQFYRTLEQMIGVG